MTIPTTSLPTVHQMAICMYRPQDRQQRGDTDNDNINDGNTGVTTDDGTDSKVDGDTHTVTTAKKNDNTDKDITSDGTDGSTDDIPAEKSMAIPAVRQAIPTTIPTMTRPTTTIPTAELTAIPMTIMAKYRQLQYGR